MLKFQHIPMVQYCLCCWQSDVPNHTEKSSFKKGLVELVYLEDKYGTDLMFIYSKMHLCVCMIMGPPLSKKQKCATVSQTPSHDVKCVLKDWYGFIFVPSNRNLYNVNNIQKLF